MANKAKYRYYVLVMTNDGPKFVTSIDRSNKYAHWDIDKPPLDLGKYWADDLALGLSLNGNVAFVVSSKWDIDRHPYRYKDGHFDWVWNKDDDDGKDGDKDPGDDSSAL